MSRHVLRDDDTYTVVVGYDDPLDSFFAQVYDVAAMRADPGGEDHLIVWTGVTPREVDDPMKCVAAVREFLVDGGDVKPDDPRLPEIGRVILALSRERADRREPTPFQRNSAKLLAGLELP